MYKDHVNNINISSKPKLIFFPIISVFLGIILFPAILGLILSLLFNSSINDLTSPAYTIGMGISLFLSASILCKMSKITFSDLGLNRKGLLKDVSIGAVIGVTMIISLVIIILLLGGIKLNYIFSSQNIFSIISAFIYFMFQVTLEELIYRGYMMPHYEKVIGEKWAIIVSSIIFTIVHGFNPNLHILSTINIFIFGIVFSAIYIKTGSLWVVGIVHGVWNFLQGYFFGSQISGNSVTTSIFYSIPQPGKNLISGGNFGYEGSIITTIIGILVIILFLKLVKINK